MNVHKTLIYHFFRNANQKRLRIPQLPSATRSSQKSNEGKSSSRCQVVAESVYVGARAS